MKSARTILLFTRAPEDEARTKRLPRAAGTCLFGGFLRSWAERAMEAGANLVIVTPHASVERLHRLLPEVSVFPQKGESFGDKLDAAFALAFGRGSSSALMVGGDGPALKLDDIHRAFAHLDNHSRSMVLVPAEDGGIMAIGFASGAERPLGGIEWLTGAVFSQLKAAAAQCHLALLITSIGRDLDSVRDVRVLYRLSFQDSIWSAFRLLLRLVVQIERHDDRPAKSLLNPFCGSTLSTRGPPLLFLRHS